MTSDSAFVGFFQLQNENPIVSKTESQQINTCANTLHIKQKYSEKGSCVCQILANFF